MGNLGKKCKVVRCLAGAVWLKFILKCLWLTVDLVPKYFFYECIGEMKTELLLEEDIGCHSREPMAEKGEI